ncbi:MAG: DUF4367 domain-containing protein, partial [Clostridia bacterium]
EAVEDSNVFMPTGLSAEFDDLLKKYGLHLPLPTWLPEGLTYDSTDVISDDEVSTDIMGKFYDGRKIVFVGVTRLHLKGTAFDMFLEKDDRLYKELEHRGQRYIIYSNASCINAFWYAPPYVCVINTRISENELLKMINSIPERRLL